MHRPYEGDSGLLQLGAGLFDVLHEEPGDRAGGEVRVGPIRGAEDLDLAAVGQPEDREVRLFVLRGQAHRLPEEPRRGLELFGPGSQPPDTPDLHGRRPFPSPAPRPPRPCPPPPRPPGSPWAAPLPPSGSSLLDGARPRAASRPLGLSP